MVRVLRSSAGNEVVATKDPSSHVHPDNVAATCGTCHEGILDKYRQSVHGRTPRDLSALPTSLDNLTSLRNAQGRYAEAEPLYHRFLVIKRTVLTQWS